jgi:alkanesulfonate monooxygenase SsuD/methylene tetrahydromethanopterin reductase-like flavin-dependent oxidoreductase (luciferase family)
MEQLGVDYERRGATLDEGLDAISSLWEGDAVDYDGDFYDLDEASIGFTPATSPSIYVASAAFDPEKGFPRPIRNRIVEHGDGWLPISMEPSQYAAGLAALRDRLESEGRDGDELIAAYYIDVVIADSKDEALDDAREFLRGYYADEQLAYQSDEAFADEVIEERGVFGPPERVTEQLAQYREAGVERFVVRFTAGDQRQQIRRFAPIMNEL